MCGECFLLDFVTHEGVKLDFYIAGADSLLQVQCPQGVVWLGKEGHVSIEETRCWSCARLELRSDGSFSCPRNRRLPKTLSHNFATKCATYVKAKQPNPSLASRFSNEKQDEGTHYTQKPLRRSGTTYPKTTKRTVPWNKQIKDMLTEGFVSRGRVRVRAPSRVRGSSTLRFKRVLRSPSRSEKPHVSRVRFLPRFTWTMEDRDIFSIYEMQTKGYCEECFNYGALRYQDGLYLCANCSYLRGNQ